MEPETDTLISVTGANLEIKFHFDVIFLVPLMSKDFSLKDYEKLGTDPKLW